MEEKKKWALVTGATSGLGRSLVLCFARNGYNIILSGRDKKRLDEVAGLISEIGVESITVRGDITLPGTVETLAKAVENGLDVLVNNAAIYAERQLREMTPEAVRRLIDTNLMAPILLTQRLFGELKKSGGLVININSLAGKESSENETVYAASKHGLRGFSRSLQFEATKHGLRIIDFYFGAIQTPMAKHRQSFELFIDTDEAAEIIFGACIERKSARVKEVEIGRRIY